MILEDPPQIFVTQSSININVLNLLRKAFAMATIRNATTRVITYYVSMTALATIAVVLRLAARSRTKLKLGADDYCVIASMFVNWAYMGVNIWGSLFSSHLNQQLSDCMNQVLFLAR